MATPSKNPPWLDALLASAYPGNQNDMSGFGPGPSPPPGPAHMGTAGGPIIPPIPPRTDDMAMNQITGMAPFANLRPSAAGGDSRDK